MASLPGEIRRLRDDADYSCDHEGCTLPASHRFCVEADSFGAEYVYLCPTHIAALREELKTADQSGYCDFCKHKADVVRPMRDIDEGMHGPVYRVCRPCWLDYNRQLAAELAADDADAYL